MNLEYILVIDDNRDVRSMVASTLIDAGYIVREAKSGHEGIQMVIHQKPDLILCDVKMPGLDGYQTLEAIRKCATTAAIPFIFITGSMGLNDFRRGMACGADDYLTKPFTPGELVAAVRTRFARRAEIQTDIFRRPGNYRSSEVPARSRPAEPRPVSVMATNAPEVPVFCLD